MNEVDRKHFKRDALSRISGHGGGAQYRWYVERPDGDFDGSDGKVYSLEQLQERVFVLTQVFIEDLRERAPATEPAPAEGGKKK